MPLAPQGAPDDPSPGRRAATSTAVVVATLLFWEFVLRLFVHPSSTAENEIFGLDLPPYVIVQGTSYDPDRSNAVWKQANKPNPQLLTNGDLQGVLREDSELGYANLENATSKRGWSVSNNLGANTSVPTLPAVPDGKRRILIFGESYGRGSRIPQPQSWSHLLQDDRPDLDVVNMSVDGFGMGQAYRRFQTVADRYDFNTVMFVLVPEADTWRDINTMRFLGEDWYAFTILPRYGLHDGALEWVPGPYAIGSDIYKHDVPDMTPRVRDHLRQHDAFYIPLLYEKPPLLGNSIIYKIVARILGERQKKAVYDAAMGSVASEGMAVERAIFRAVQASVAGRRRQFVLVLLPNPELLVAVRKTSDARRLQVWNDKARAFQEDGLTVIDMLPDMRLLADGDIDRGVDGTHYGAKAQRAIATILEHKLTQALSNQPPASSDACGVRSVSP